MPVGFGEYVVFVLRAHFVTVEALNLPIFQAIDKWIGSG
jgi:hypothetical protein